MLMGRGLLWADGKSDLCFLELLFALIEHLKAKFTEGREKLCCQVLEVSFSLFCCEKCS